VCVILLLVNKLNRFQSGVIMESIFETYFKNAQVIKELYQQAKESYGLDAKITFEEIRELEGVQKDIEFFIDRLAEQESKYNQSVLVGGF
jgi:hypothetical protein